MSTDQNKEVCLDSNDLTELPEMDENVLEYLRFTYNQITSIDSLSKKKLAKLRYMAFQYNKVKNLPKLNA